jgi:hypothetical protein
MVAIAHLGFRGDELVIRRRWINETGYADLIALCQFYRGRPPPGRRQCPAGNSDRQER